MISYVPNILLNLCVLIKIILEINSEGCFLIIIPVAYVRKPELREVKQLDQGHSDTHGLRVRSIGGWHPALSTKLKLRDF